ncbi:probable inactive ATP-dependent zinc metalloprotease FTSHI 3, chloroplastic [Pyrus x bretschneideri]|uniref:probable inactive ATP-dependent zinc metalloprotease FTSHI 3, chloroplastic n=1 Tax=Pyrus x bretschneideri TaxID=225117 RepID=UPI00202E86E3|nr:probable inactive ATP-dependent zinc metalloprotease FTSHI 3, chloroplastic [Pyrus x bretschneideri]XP_048434004.1 probable inactive ATP-dependent zinc metalloprotease FTSHI 3, chloroplastic [Pyrus x bretschneideri]XP_048434005.1 probable inactive ATP-dependent zinc metalloprotease FTSHI 3, chloroplastic [Pyrus x bretschneideri]
MASCFSVVSNTGFLSVPNKLEFNGGKSKSLGRYKDFYCSSFGFRSAGFHKFRNFQHGLFWNNELRPLMNGNNGVWLEGLNNCCNSRHKLCCYNKIEPLTNANSANKQIHLGKKGDTKLRSLRRRFSLRLRPRLRWLAMRVKRVTIQSVLNGVRTFLRKNIRRVTLVSLVSVILGLTYLFLKLTAVPSPKMVPYSELVTSLRNESVTKVLLEEGSRRIYYNTNSRIDGDTQLSEGELPSVQSENVADKVTSDDGSRSSQALNTNVLRNLSATQASTPDWQYLTRKVDHDEKFLLSLMREKGITYSSAPQSVLMSMRTTLITIISLWIPLMPLMWLLYRQLSAANSPARKQRPDKQSVGFEDVEGVDAAKLELMEIVLCLQGAINYNKLGAKLPRGVLLVGPPGTGKTLLARAVAGEAGVPFFSVSASEFVEMFVGRGAARIRDLFNMARKHSPSIIFIDELDAVGTKRGRSFNDERDQTLNQLLTEMDGFESDSKVIVVAATNRPEVLDSALCRPGRFSRKIVVGEPDEEGRRKILAVHLRGVPLEEDTNLICDLIASLTPGFVGADLANIINEAALLAARRGGETVAREDVMEAIERAKFGINDKQLRPSTISKELGKMFPWMPSLMGKNTRQDGVQGPLGYQTLS